MSTIKRVNSYYRVNETTFENSVNTNMFLFIVTLPSTLLFCRCQAGMGIFTRQSPKTSLALHRSNFPRTKYKNNSIWQESMESKF